MTDQKKTKEENVKSTENVNIRPIQAEIDVLKGRFTNTVSVGYTKFDFCIDFIAVDSNSDQTPAQVVGRFYMTPAQAKVTRDLLDKQVRDYEEKHGEITTK